MLHLMGPQFNRDDQKVSFSKVESAHSLLKMTSFFFLKIKKKKYLGSPGVMTVQLGSPKHLEGTSCLRRKVVRLCPGLESLVWFWPPAQPL